MPLHIKMKNKEHMKSPQLSMEKQAGFQLSTTRLFGTFPNSKNGQSDLLWKLVQIGVEFLPLALKVVKEVPKMSNRLRE